MGFTYSPKVVTDGLVLYLDAANPLSYANGSTKWNDLSRGRNSGGIYNGTTYSSDVKGNFSFDGGNDYIQFPYNSDFEFQYNSTFSIELFAYINESEGNGYLITNRSMSDGNGASFTGWGILQHSGRVLFSIGGYPGGYSWRSVECSPTDFTTYCFQKWSHISVTNTGVAGEQKMYINGEDVSTNQDDDQTPPYTVDYNGTHNLTLGRSDADNNGGHYLNGDIAVAKIYNRALTSQEIQRNYQALKSRFGL